MDKSRIRLYDEKYPTTNILDIDLHSVEEGIAEDLSSIIGVEYADQWDTEEHLFSRAELDDIDLDAEMNLESFIGEVETIKELCDKYNAAYFRFIS